MIPVNSNTRVGAAALRTLLTLFGAFTGTTACWIAWGVGSGGDWFGQGSPFVDPSLIAAGVVGGFAAFKTRSKRLRVAWAILTLACALFWVVVPGDWWVLPPPGRSPHGGSNVVGGCGPWKHYFARRFPFWSDLTNDRGRQLGFLS